MIIKPVIASAGMGAAVYFAYENMVVQGLSQNKSTFVAIVIGAFIYALLLFIIGEFKDKILKSFQEAKG